ncbi:hypothetical protein [Mycobacterium sp. 1245852.3]|uniref:hypothetical protein n=1 Tax=Mycobacterium sp. 1245852.3 TaxID=1856860 RepID=UPI0007FB8286|nr:hypothetical protein [Mycobacterium sp. 1245852.3]OBJ90553.1 hypothetical protein A9W96_22835 [Mycobacterium sp. 1245852.3]
MAVSNADLLALARGLPIPVPWDRDAFVKNVAELRGRPIRLIAVNTTVLADSPCGLWLTRDDDDLILHEAGSSEYHIDQIVCHEIGHMLLRHTRLRQFGDDNNRESELCRTILPDIDPASVRAVLGRMDYASDQERDAEMFANMLMIAAAESATNSSMMRTVFFRPR